MKKIIIAVVTLLFSGLVQAQESKDSAATVRIKKIENINGVERISDTTYTTDDPSALMIMEGPVTIKDCKDPEKGKVVIVRSGEGEEQIIIPEIAKEGEIQVEQFKSSKGNSVQKIVIKDNDLLSDSLHVLISELPENTGRLDQDLLRINRELSQLDIKDDGTGQKIKSIVIIKNVRISEASAEDIRRLGKTAGTADNKLPVSEMKFYPNPGDGKFTLTFNLDTRGNTDIAIFDINGRQVYNEKLPDFTGQFEKKLDISKEPRGAYFVKVSQGSHSQLKKIVLD